jgi:hypothetical protein
MIHPIVLRVVILHSSYKERSTPKSKRDLLLEKDFSFRSNMYAYPQKPFLQFRYIYSLLYAGEQMMSWNQTDIEDIEE